MKIILKGGRIIDPSQNIDKIADLIIEDDQIHSIVNDIDCSDSDEVYHCKDLWVVPGLVDIHARFNEPGHKHRESILTGTQSAASGGYTMIGYSPFTTPPIDNTALINHIIDESASPESGGIYLAPISMASLGGIHQEIVDIESLKEIGVVAISDDGVPIQDPQFFWKVLKSCSEVNMPFLLDPRDTKISANGSMHDGSWAAVLGLKGIPSLSEEIMVARGCLMALHSECQTHIMRISTAGSVQIIRKAKLMGAPISAEVSPHHLIFTDRDINEYNSMFKTMPPLRSEKDRDALIEGLIDGTIDCICSDHTPYTHYEIDVPFEQAPFGSIGFDTAFSSVYTHLTKPNILSPLETISKLSYQPANILGTEGGSFMAGETPFAQITVIDPMKTWTYDVNDSFSKGKNSPFHEREFTSKVLLTFCGQEVYRSKDFDPKRHAINMQSILA